MKQLEFFRDFQATAQIAKGAAPIEQPADEPETLSDLVAPNSTCGGREALTDNADGPPKAVALPAAIEAGVFGVDTDRPIVPTDEQIADLTAEHANEMIILLAESVFSGYAICCVCKP